MDELINRIPNTNERHLLPRHFPCRHQGRVQTSCCPLALRAQPLVPARLPPGFTVFTLQTETWESVHLDQVPRARPWSRGRAGLSAEERGWGGSVSLPTAHLCPYAARGLARPPEPPTHPVPPSSHTRLLLPFPDGRGLSLPRQA